MKKVNSLQGLSDIMYTGKLENKQIPTSSFVDYTRLNKNQQEMYNKLMVGLKLYTKEELYKMNSSKKNKIFKRFKQVQSMINLWKQQILIAKTNPVFEIFNNSSISKALVDVSNQTDDKFLCKLKFKDLGITKDKIVNKLIAENFLPQNFATL
jgi:hypothetical protein|tara:strand:+ start:724 stop:1182 length:459 start_codon:yes stop_codon:yes gene_type:complete